MTYRDNVKFGDLAPKARIVSRLKRDGSREENFSQHYFES